MEFGNARFRLVDVIDLRLLALLVAFGVSAMSPSFIHAQTALPHVIIGAAKVDGVMVPDGSQIAVWSGEDRLATAAVSDGRYSLQVPRPESTEPLSLTVGAFMAPQTFRWQRGEITVLNLDASGDTALLVLAIEPLGSNLERVFYFDEATDSWLFYDPRPQFQGKNSLTVLVTEQVYWMDVTEAQSVNLNGQFRHLESGGTELVW